MAFSGCVGQCASTHNLNAVERFNEVWAVWRAFFFFFWRRSQWSSGS